MFGTTFDAGFEPRLDSRVLGPAQRVIFGERAVLLSGTGPAPQVPVRLLVPGDGPSVRARAATARWRHSGATSGPPRRTRELVVPGVASRADRVRRQWGVRDRSGTDAATADRLGLDRRPGDVRSGEVLGDWGYWRHRVAYLADRSPDSELARLLEERPDVADTPFGGGLPSGLDSPRALLRLDSMAARQRLINALQGEQFADAAALAVEYPAKQEFLAAEVMLALQIPESAAGALLAEGHALITRLPGTLAAVRAGRVTAEIASVMVGATAVVTDPIAAQQIEATVLPTVAFRSRESVRRSVCREVIRLDPAGADERHESARKGRRVTRWGDADGMGWLKIHAPIQNIATAWEVLTGLAAAARTPDDDRTADQRRTDAFVGICQAILDRGGWHDTLLPEQHGRKPHIGVLIPYDLLDLSSSQGRRDKCGRDGRDGQGGEDSQDGVPADRQFGDVCEVAGYGPIGPAQARRIAADGVWQRLVCDPLTGALLDYGHTRYVPPDRLKQFVVTRDQECTMVGCSVPSWRGQIDHAVPFAAGGPTAAANLHAPCQHHHRSKDGGGWKVVINVDHSTTWTSPLGRSATKPAARLIRPRLIRPRLIRDRLMQPRVDIFRPVVPDSAAPPAPF